VCSVRRDRSSRAGRITFDVAVHPGVVEGELLNHRRWKAEWSCARRTLQAAENESVAREGRKPVELPHLATRDLRHAHPWPGEEDRTRTVMDAVLGGLRAGCGPGDTATKETAGQMA